MKKIGWLVLGCVVVLGGCSRQQPVEGERLDLRQDLNAVDTDLVEAEPDYGRAIVGPMISLSSWPQIGGNPAHRSPNNGLSDAPVRVWSASIGSGNSRRARISADPVISGGRLFAMDSASMVTAFTLDGERLWSQGLSPARDREDDASSGGLAAQGDQVFATTGFGEVIALDAASGEIQWRQDLEAAATGAPAVANGTVFAIGRDGLAWAINASNGRVRWTASALVDGPGILGGASPAVSGDFVYLPFRTGQISAARIDTGQGVWIARISGRRQAFPTATISDLQGDPVIADGRLYAGSHAGRSAAIDLATGSLIWSAEEGAMSAPVVTDNSVFQVTDRNALVRLDAETGETVWLTELPLYEESRVRRRRDFYAHYGPILAGNRLWVASNDSRLRSFDPSTGAEMSSINIGAAAAANPIVVGNTLYIVTGNGQIHAFR